MALPVGILPYESSDSSIIFKCSLKSPADVAAPEIGPAGTITNASTARFDPVLGFRPAESGNSGITFSSITGFESLDNCGQLSFEISRAVLCVDTRQSVGSNPGSVQWTLTHGNGSNYGAIRKVGGTPPSFVWRTRDSGDTQGLAYFHSEEKSEFVRLTYSWSGGTLRMFVDGKPVNHWSTAPSRITRWVNQFQNVHCMSFASGGSPNRDGYMRNLLIAKEPVAIFKNPNSRVTFLGHSFATSYSIDTAATPANYDNTVGSLLRQAAVSKGYDLDLSVAGVGGGYWDPAITAFDILDYVDDAMLTKPHFLVLYGGTNDVGGGSYTDAGYEAALQTALTTIGTDGWASNIRKIILFTTPSRSGLYTNWDDATRSRIDSSNAIIAALPAWWDATYPALAGKLVVEDLFAAWGGMYPARSVMVGQRTGSFDDLHPTSLGCSIIAELVSKHL